MTQDELVFISKVIELLEADDNYKALCKKIDTDLNSVSDEDALGNLPEIMESLLDTAPIALKRRSIRTVKTNGHFDTPAEVKNMILKILFTDYLFCIVVDKRGKYIDKWSGHEWYLKIEKDNSVYDQRGIRLYFRLTTDDVKELPDITYKCCGGLSAHIGKGRVEGSFLKNKITLVLGRAKGEFFQDTSRMITQTWFEADDDTFFGEDYDCELGQLASELELMWCNVLGSSNNIIKQAVAKYKE